MIIGIDVIISLGIDIHGADMTIPWDDAAIRWRDIDSTTNDVFALSQYNAPFNSETKRTLNQQQFSVSLYYMLIN